MSLMESIPLPPRARGEAYVSMAGAADTSRLSDLRQAGSLRVLFPRSPDPVAVLLNTAGGITGGDRFETRLEVQEGAALTVTTQAAERAYASTTDTPGRVSTIATVASEGVLHWLPQETILYDHSALGRKLDIELASRSRLLLVEPLVFGRAAHGETLRQAQFTDRIRVTRDGGLIFADGITLDGDVEHHLRRPPTANGAGAMATLVLVDPGAQQQKQILRDIFKQFPKIVAACSAPTPDLLVMRVLARDSFEMRCLLLPVLDHLTGQRLPICWRL